MSLEKITDTRAGVPPETLDVTSPLKERSISDPETLSAREFSKDSMAGERGRLAVEISQERREGRDRIAELRIRANLLKNKLERARQGEGALEAEVETLDSVRTEQANALAERVTDFTGSEEDSNDQEKIAAELEETMGQLIDADAVLATLREKVTNHYVEASVRPQRTVEQTMLRNNSFFVHVILKDSYKRHNINSAVLKDTTFGDDLDILLSLEPSLSASSVVPGADAEGRVSGLWSDEGGVLLGGGQISSYSKEDSESVSIGIKKRAQKEMDESAYQHIPRAENFDDANPDAITRMDEVVTNRGAWQTGQYNRDKSYNEFVIDNPEAVGYFKHAAVDENGQTWISLGVKEKLAELHTLYAQDPRSSTYRVMMEEFNAEVNRYRQEMSLAEEKGLSLFVMTPDRRFFEVLKIKDGGSIDIGSELTPHEVARGRAGLLPEKRKEIGKALLERNVFKGRQTQEEARKVIESLDTESATTEQSSTSETGEQADQLSEGLQKAA